MSEFAWVAAAVVAVTSASRITRLFTYDSYPPVMWIRMKWDALTESSPEEDAEDKPPNPFAREHWNVLFHCGYCFSFWVMVVIVAWGWLTDFGTAWWLVNSIFGGSYLAAILMANDGEDDL